MKKLKVVYVKSRDEITPVDGKLGLYDIGHGREAVMTCWEPEKGGQEKYVYVKDKDGYVKTENGGCLVLNN